MVDYIAAEALDSYGESIESRNLEHWQCIVPNAPSWIPVLRATTRMQFHDGLIGIGVQRRVF